jgi:hypothetical protein
MKKEKFMEWIRENFDIPGSTWRLINNILCYCEKLPESNQESALLELLSGSIGLTENEIKSIVLSEE